MITSEERELSISVLAHHHKTVLWRGVRNVRTTHHFLQYGGSELAPCSMTPDLEIAVRYAKDWQAEYVRGERALTWS